VSTKNIEKRSIHVLPQDRELCACTTLRGLARRATAIYDEVLEPVGLKQTQYSVLARLDRLVHCSLGELAEICDLDVTSLSRGLRPLIANGWVKSGPGKDDRTKRYELTARGKQGVRKAFALWKKAQSRLHKVIAPEHVRALDSLSGILKGTYLGER
jgi:DNA-binding MarR family transcriptional regulator